MKIKKLRASTGMTQQMFGDYFGIPRKTVQAWELEERECPQYLLKLIEYRINNKEKESDILFDCKTCATRSVKELRAQSGMTQKAFSEYFGMSKRAVEEWEGGRRKCPDYLLRLMEYKLRMEWGWSDDGGVVS
ncbi:MAG: helix-turn-helix domain-containing protein [Candidatus Spyradocola sp.]